MRIYDIISASNHMAMGAFYDILHHNYAMLEK